MESSLNRLLLTLMISEANFRMLHWMCSGDKFEQMHTNSDSYRDMTCEDIDAVAEMILRVTNNIPTIKSVSNYPNAIIDTHGNLINFDTWCSYTEKIFNGILDSISDCLKEESIANDVTNVGIKASLESMYDKYDLQARYLIKRRMM